MKSEDKDKGHDYISHVKIIWDHNQVTELENNMQNNNVILSVEEFATFMKIGRNTAYNLVNTTGFPCFKVGAKKIKIDLNDALNWLKTRS